MRAIEVTIQNLIGSGMVPKLENNPYLCFVYTSFQERATKISHGHTAKQAGDYGDDVRFHAMHCTLAICIRSYCDFVSSPETKLREENATNAEQKHMQVLRNVAGAIAADESRHEIAYTKIVGELFERDPDGAMLSFAGTPCTVQTRRDCRNWMQ